MTRLHFSYGEARALTTEESDAYLDAWEELNRGVEKKQIPVKRKKN
jgi:hypothetical protein